MTDAREFFISDSAAKHIAQIRDAQSNPDLIFRITVSGGGCSGFKYLYEFEEGIEESDIQFKHGDVTVVTDDMSLNFLNGAELDFQQDLMGSRFAVNNPNASSSCGCGTSFSMAFDNAPISPNANE